LTGKRPATPAFGDQLEWDGNCRDVDALLAPVREALSDARTDLAAAARGFQNNEDAKIEARIHAKLDAALASLSPQPPEAQQ
jgi:hypothetical protein